MSPYSTGRNALFIVPGVGNYVTMANKFAAGFSQYVTESPFAPDAATIGGIHAGAFSLHEPQPVYFAPVNPLEAAIVDAATTPETLPQFYLDFPSSEFLVVTEVAPRGIVGLPRETILGRDGINIKTLQVEKHAIFPIFSSVDRFRPLFKSQVNFVRLKGKEIADISRNMHLLLNPGYPYSKLFLCEEVRGILDRSLFTKGASRLMPIDTPHTIAPALACWDRLTQSLTNFLSEYPAVQSATLATFGKEGNLAVAMTFASSVPATRPGETSVVERIMGCTALVAHPFMAESKRRLFFFRESDVFSANQAECQAALAKISPFFSR